jgi:7,8-dihydropterin-6-yl-methyl-4-(beta-D-ribofuranosyl)aminobenzene 5'-phosphate synthase
MTKLIMIVVGILVLPGTLFGYVMLRYRQNRVRASRVYDDSGHPRDDGSRLVLLPVTTLEVLPLIDWYAASSDLETESGVSYLVRADDTTILFDLGLNRNGEQEPPLLRNMARLGVDPAEIDFVLLSHPHGDHMGGFRNQLARQAIVRRQHDPLAGRPVYATASLKLTHGRSTIIQAPGVLAAGVATTGPLPRALFLMGYVQEQALVIHVAGKGLVLVVGCGHPSIEAFVERAEQLCVMPVYGVIGGLHFPVTDDRAHIGPFRMQQLLGSPNPPWRPIDKQAVRRTVGYLKARGIEYLAPSAHDTCDWSLHVCAEAFGSGYHPVKVGERLRILEKRSA